MHGRSTHSPSQAQPGIIAPGERTASPGALGATLATLPHAGAGPAVVLLGATEAVIARGHAGGHDEIVRVKRVLRVREACPFLVRICHEVGSRSPVVIMGPAAERTAFERELVLISHRPDCFIEDAAVHDAHPEALLERLRSLRGHPG